MSFIRGHIDPSKGVGRYEKLGYTRNPFPLQGEVSPDVFVARPELNELQSDLTAFLSGRPQGKVWALQGEQGVGKSNFLHYLAGELEAAQVSGEISNTASRLFSSLALSPSRLVEGMVAAIGAPRVTSLINKRPRVPVGYEGTDLARFWESISEADQGFDSNEAAQFLVRWLSGQQTLKADREKYGILAREKLAPAVALPYLRGLVDMLEQAELLRGIVILVDEFEDVQSLTQSKQTEYIQMLKTLLNAFNWRGLYVILAGAPYAFTSIAEKLPSLAARWTPIRLKPVETTEMAVELAREYKKKARMNGQPRDLSPTDIDVQAMFIKLFNEEKPVKQRRLLTALHEQVERLLVEQQSKASLPKRKMPSEPR